MKENNELFFKVFNNIYINQIIFKYVRIYNENKCKIFSSRKELIEYKEREYIEFIKYTGKEEIKYGDLPLYGVLEKVSIADYDGTIDSIIIPMGVSKVIYSKKHGAGETKLSTLQKSVTSLKNVMFNSTLDKTNNSSSLIPETIEKIGFHVSIHPSYLNGKILPKSLKKLSIPCIGSDYPFISIFCANDPPIKIETLSIGIVLESGKERQLLSFLPKSLKTLNLGIRGQIPPFSLPNSLTTLNLKLMYYSSLDIKRDMIPQSVTNLKIERCFFVRIEGDSLNKLLNLTKLSFINAPIVSRLTINTLPPNLEILELTLGNHKVLIENHCFPENLTYLNFVDTLDTYRNCGGSGGDNLQRFKILDINFFSKSLKSLTLPFTFNQPLKLTEEYVLKTNSSIKNAINSIFQNKKFTPGYLIPRNVESLSIKSLFNQPINIGDLPDSLTFLKIGDIPTVFSGDDIVFIKSKFEQTLLKNSIPNNIKTLILPDDYCIYLLNDPKYIDIIPNSIKTLKFLIRDTVSANSILIQKIINNLLIDIEDENNLITLDQLLLSLKKNDDNKLLNIPSSIQYLQIGYKIFK
ncbi:hypothetical protein ACTFIZ_003335 [Dictyostelium cf. discoideum]